MCPKNDSEKIYLSSTHSVSSSSLKNKNSLEKSIEVRRHSETPGNFTTPTALYIANFKNDEEKKMFNSLQNPKVCKIKALSSSSNKTIDLKSNKSSKSCENIEALEILFEDPKVNNGDVQKNNNKDRSNAENTAGAWKILEEEIGDVNLLIQTYSEKCSIKEKVRFHI